MTLYVKNPIVIEAFRLIDGDYPEWFTEKLDKDIHLLYGIQDILLGAEIKTLEGKMFAQLHDYIIKGVKGEIYPCKPDIFEQSYDKY